MSADTRFDDLLEQIRALQARKRADYGDDGDPFANIRASAQFGVRPWAGALLRLNEKVHRLARFVKRGTLANESAEDSMLDVAVYALIALILYREESEQAPKMITRAGALVSMGTPGDGPTFIVDRGKPPAKVVID